jgi:hypothetical protein
VYLKARLKLSAAEGVREAVLAAQGFAIASRWMFAPESQIGRSDEHSRRMDASANGPVGHLSLGPIDVRKRPVLSSNGSKKPLVMRSKDSLAAI